MTLKVELSVGDFLDRLSILQIKLGNGLDVSKEINQYQEQFTELDSFSAKHWLEILAAVNKALWDLEEEKRKQVNLEVGHYVVIAELITILNDLRAVTKMRIDKFYKSSIIEQKSHNFGSNS